MSMQLWKVQIRCQKGKTLQQDLIPNGKPLETDGVKLSAARQKVGGCTLGRIGLSIHKEDVLGEGFYLSLEAPVRVELPLPEVPEKITALYLYNPWWTRPAFVDTPKDIPTRTQVAFFKYKDRCGCFVPMVGERFKAQLMGGTESSLYLDMFSCVGGADKLDEPLYLYAEAPTALEAAHKAFAWLTQEKNILPRDKRHLPEMFRYLGWCSWDAFYTKVNDEGIRRKALELVRKQVPVKWMLIDDGWFPAKDKRICGFAPDPEKFPHGFRPMIEDLRKNADVQWFGVWHALGGYWGGVDPDSELARSEAPYLYRGAEGCLVPSPKAGSGFYRDWCAVLKAQGIDFIKVDGQSAASFYFENHIPVSQAARGLNAALESGAFAMEGAVINCMGMAMENVLARPATALSRNSDDFLPGKEESFVEHLLQNAYNALYHDEIYYCDWDMFWTRHKHAVRHSLLRAISGGPVYFSDAPGETEAEVIKPLVTPDGKLLMMSRSAKPTEDCIFMDPREQGVLKLHNIAPWGEHGNAGGIAVYNLTQKHQPVVLTPADIPDLDRAGQYWIYDWFAHKAGVLTKEEPFVAALEGEGYAWYVLLPKGRCGACLGLLDKYVGFTAIESIREVRETQTIVLRASGTVGWLCDRKPATVSVDGVDVTKNVRFEDRLYTLPLPEKAQKTVLTVCW